jgi:hypothetical protein
MHPDAKIRYEASDMILNVHSDASYLSAPKAHSHAGVYFFLGSILQDAELIFINGTVPLLSTFSNLLQHWPLKLNVEQSFSMYRN